MSTGWSIDPTSFIDGVEEDLEKRHRAIAMTVFNQVVQLSPVDSGRYRANHIMSIGSPDYSFSEGRGGFKAGVGVLNGLKTGNLQPVYIQNNLPYAQRLENGWSQQAPTGVYQLAYDTAVDMYC